MRGGNSEERDAGGTVERDPVRGVRRLSRWNCENRDSCRTVGKEIW